MQYIFENSQQKTSFFGAGEDTEILGDEVKIHVKDGGGGEFFR